MYRFIKPFLGNKMSIFEGYGALKVTCTVYMYKVIISLNNFSSETTQPIFIKFHVAPTVETVNKMESLFK